MVTRLTSGCGPDSWIANRPRRFLLSFAKELSGENDCKIFLQSFSPFISDLPPSLSRRPSHRYYYRDVPIISTGCLYMNIIIPVQKWFRSELSDARCRSHGACSIGFSLGMYCNDTSTVYCTLYTVPVSYTHLTLPTTPYV